MVRLGYGSLQPEQFVGFRFDLTQGAWKLGSAGHSKNGGVPLFKTPVVIYFKGVLVHAVDQVVVAQGAANDSADTRWSQAERRFVARVQVLMLDDDPATVEAAGKVQTILADGGSTQMVNRSADDKVDFGRNQLELAATPDVAALVKQLGLNDALDDIRTCTDELAAAIGRGEVSTGNLPRSRRIEVALSACTAAFNWVHEGLLAMSERTDDAIVRTQLEAMIASLDTLLARRTVQVPVVADPQPAPAPIAAPNPAQQPLAHTG